MFKGLVEILYFVPDRRAAADWYVRLFGVDLTQFEEPEWYFIRIGNQEIWFHQADDKGPSGVAGQVAYWQVDDFDAALAHAQSIGGQLYRGPLDRLDGTFMCQVKDPFGNAFGMIGPRKAQHVQE